MENQTKALGLRMIPVVAAMLVLTACGGGGGSTTTLQQVQALVATGSAANLDAAMILANDTCDTVSAVDCEALMNALPA